MGGSTGARMAAWLGKYGTKFFGGKDLIKPGTVVMQYTGLSEIFNDPPIYLNCSTSDRITNYKVMNNRINKIREMELML